MVGSAAIVIVNNARYDATGTTEALCLWAVFVALIIFVAYMVAEWIKLRK